MNFDTILEIGRFALGFLLVPANFAVWYGVWLERDSAPPEVQQRGWRILVRGLAAETAIGFLVFALDTSIGIRQANEISAANERAANAVREAGRLGVKVDTLPSFVTQKESEINGQISAFQKFATDQQAQDKAAIAELTRAKDVVTKARTDAITAANAAIQTSAAMAAANAPRALLPNQQTSFVEQMRPFMGLSANVFTMPSNTPDAAPLADMLGRLLISANWKVGGGVPIAGYAKYVLVCIGDKPPPNVEAAAKTLVLALRADGIQAFIDTTLGPNVPFTGAGSPLGNPDMTILVGTKQ